VAIRACNGRRKGGDPCGAPPLLDGDFCLWHDPEHADVVAEARRVGGSRRRKEATIAVAYAFEGLAAVPQIRRLVEVAVTDVLSLDNSIARARTLAYLAQTATKLLEVGELEQRLERVEQALKARQERSKR
jgi:hypothetical protein